ncbi:glutathione S-transferase family protein [Halioxenophilus sp. WMMB6]|uniref:glutathione S-transferase family protein n=1 Tax=Halioxenophilus sp. WMMB6 TaxID=3073815 RepID=UPI00295F0A58|nr:glutathione S-transferase family protein [Halioxenophilus sp. WMMB6]
MITIYHLGASQSDRVVWLMEELGLPYQLEVFERNEQGLTPEAYRALHPVATAPVIRDGDLVLCESAAIVEYIINRHGGGRLGVTADQHNYADYLYWSAFAASYQSSLLMHVALNAVTASNERVDHLRVFNDDRVRRYQEHLNARLGEYPYLAGVEFSGADILNVFNLVYWPKSGGAKVDHFDNVAAYIKRIEERPAYQKAMAIAWPEN